jgi:hypothetical protein
MERLNGPERVILGLAVGLREPSIERVNDALVVGVFV